MAEIDVILRSGTEAIIPEEVSHEIIQGAVAQSAVLSIFRRLPNMASNKYKMPVLDMLPMAYFVNGDTGQKKTTKMAWKNKYIIAEEIAVIVPIPEAVLDDARDSGYDIWSEVTPRVQESFGKVIDNAIMFDVQKPSTWRDGLVKSAIAAGNVVTSTGDIFIDLFGEDGLEAKVENSGFIPNGAISSVQMRGKLRGVRDDNKNPIFMKSMSDGNTTYALDGMPMSFLVNGAWDTTKAHMIMGDMSQAVYSIRQDMTVKLLTEAVIQDTDGSIIYNLAQQDMVALRFVMRLGWELPNPINALSPNEATRFPFAVYVPQATPAPANLSLDEGNTLESPYKSMTKDELKALLDEQCIQYTTSMTKDELIALLEV